MSAISLNCIIKSFELFDIERALVILCALKNGIDTKASAYITNYIGDFEPSAALIEALSVIQNLSIEDLSVAMELLIPQKDKIVNGAFFTPSYIVDYIVDNVAPKSDDKVADISCGSGTFLLGILRYFLKHYDKSVKDVISKNIYGADILDYNIRRSKIILSLFALSKGEILEENDFNLNHCNSLVFNWDIKFNCIVGNPPYVKFQDLENPTRDFLSKNYGSSDISSDTTVV